jgi:hypothetical protein
MFARSEDELEGAFASHLEAHSRHAEGGSKRARPRKVRVGRASRSSVGRIRIVSGGLPTLGKRR